MIGRTVPRGRIVSSFSNVNPCGLGIASEVGTPFSVPVAAALQWLPPACAAAVVMSSQHGAPYAVEGFTALDMPRARRKRRLGSGVPEEVDEVAESLPLLLCRLVLNGVSN